ncbi:MAG: hypothetical protein C4B59_10905 [Candidatus Methanogaster sp.]|uniref:Uncharacterized protein n=1 Tax=Candidatus Methanogaster sp. TaxID=3386292 RepID=A0AC61L1D4_9EURY|nr:MAG: hypothetical protein C4B59_10905 [ANME-2 cluster archaeon]
MNRTTIVLPILCISTAIIGITSEAPVSTDKQTAPDSMVNVPAFEAVFAVIGLLTMAIVLIERQKRT